MILSPICLDLLFMNRAVAYAAHQLAHAYLNPLKMNSALNCMAPPFTYKIELSVWSLNNPVSLEEKMATFALHERPKPPF